MMGFEEEDLLLQKEDHMYLPTLSYAYGAGQVAAEYCGFENVPYAPRGQWQHGWVRSDCLLDPKLAIWDDGKADPNAYHWLSRKEIEDYLRGHGYKNATAIGLGMVYVPEIDIPRLPNSLLVMPIHSLWTTTHDNWDFELYFNEINNLREHFDHVAICVHPACMAKGYWVDAFREGGYEVIDGALFGGRHALKRLQWLLRRFEYVTSNDMGTHVAYSAFHGAKFSFYGTFQESRREDYVGKAELFERHPHILDWRMEFGSRAWVEKYYPDLFVENPADAKVMDEWGAHQIGYDIRLSPKDLRDAFCWPSPNPVISPSIAFEGEKSENIDDFEEDPAIALFNGQPGTAFEVEDFYRLYDMGKEGSPWAQYLLSLVYEQGLCLQYCSPDEALYWCLKAAEQGLDVAVLRAALMLRERGDQRAEDWMARARKLAVED